MGYFYVTCTDYRPEHDTSNAVEDSAFASDETLREVDQWMTCCEDPSPNSLPGGYDSRLQACLRQDLCSVLTVLKFYCQLQKSTWFAVLEFKASCLFLQLDFRAAPLPSICCIRLSNPSCLVECAAV